MSVEEAFDEAFEMIKGIDARFVMVAEPLLRHLWKAAGLAENAVRQDWEKLRKADIGLWTCVKSEVRQFHEVRFNGIIP